MPTLVINGGPAAGASFDLFRHRLVLLGRDEDCTFQVRDPRVSRRHMQIRYRPDTGRHYAIDFGSANGVLVNGERIPKHEEVRLEDRDEIVIGHSLISYVLAYDPEAEQAMRGLRLLGERRRSTLVGVDESAPRDAGAVQGGGTPLRRGV